MRVCGRSPRVVVAAVALATATIGVGLMLVPAAAVARGSFPVTMAREAAPAAATSVGVSVPSGRAAQKEEPADEGAPEVGDPASTRRAYLVIAGLIVLGMALAGFTIWFWRSTRPEPVALARLEMMGLRRWERADYTDRKNWLDNASDFVGGEGPLISAAAVDGEPPSSAEHAPQLTDEAEVATLAELVESTPEVPFLPIGSIGDPDVLKSLGLDDESLGISAATPSRESWWSHSERVPVIDAEFEPHESDEMPGPQEARMNPLFSMPSDDPGAVAEAPPVWKPGEELSDEEIHEREATGEFDRLLEMRDHADDVPPEQQRFSLPGEPFL